MHSIVGERAPLQKGGQLSDVDSAVDVTPRHWLYYEKETRLRDMT